MRRYRKLDSSQISNALTKLTSALLAAKTLEDVNEIIQGLFTTDERVKIGRRIQVAKRLKQNKSYRQISSELKIGMNTISSIENSMSENDNCFEMILSKDKQVRFLKTQKKVNSTGGSKLVYTRRKVSSGYNEVKR